MARDDDPVAVGFELARVVTEPPDSRSYVVHLVGQGEVRLESVSATDEHSAGVHPWTGQLVVEAGMPLASDRRGRTRARDGARRPRGRTRPSTGADRARIEGRPGRSAPPTRPPPHRPDLEGRAGVPVHVLRTTA